MTTPGCETHTGLPSELRALALAALDRLEPAVDRLRTEPTTSANGTCAGCPVCALIAVLRGDRPELAARLAEQVGGALAALRAALEEGVGEFSPPVERTAAGSPRLVQRIPVERAARPRRSPSAQ